MQSQGADSIVIFNWKMNYMRTIPNQINCYFFNRSIWNDAFSIPIISNDSFFKFAFLKKLSFVWYTHRLAHCFGRSKIIICLFAKSITSRVLLTAHAHTKTTIIIFFVCIQNFWNFNHEPCLCFSTVAVKLNQYSWKKNFDHAGNRKIAMTKIEVAFGMKIIQYTILLDHSYSIGLILVTKNRKHMPNAIKSNRNQMIQMVIDFLLRFGYFCLFLN